MGHEKAVRIFLDRQDPDAGISEHESGQTPFSCAAGNGCDGIVKMFLDRDGVDPNVKDNDGQTPIMLAASRGCEGVVKILLGHNDIKPDIPDGLGRTATSLATENGHGGVLEVLLERQDVNPNTTRNDSGQTPLLWAAENGRERMVNILLCRKDVDPNMTDVQGRTSLSWAAENGHEEVVRMLLSRKDINPDIAENNSARTPLLGYARFGPTELVAPNLNRINPDRPDNHFGQTPLLSAAESGYEEIINFLAWKDIGHNREDNNSRTPFWLPAKNVVGMWLRSDDVNLNTAEDTLGRTPLIWAARNGCVGVVRSLLEREDVDVNWKDKDGRTPLLWAAFGGHVEVVQVLLARKDINTDAADTQYGLTPLLWAALGGSKGVAQFLWRPDEGDSECSYLCSTAIRGELEGARGLFSGYDLELTLNALNEQDYTPTHLSAILRASGRMEHTLKASLNTYLRKVCSGPGLLTRNVEDEYKEVVKMLLDHQDKGNGSNQALTHLSAQDEQVLATRPKSLELVIIELEVCGYELCFCLVLVFGFRWIGKVWQKIGMDLKIGRFV